MKKKVKKKKSFKQIIVKIIDIIMLVGFYLLSIFLIANIIKLSNIENMLRLIVGLIIFFIFLTIAFLYKKKKRILTRVLMVLLSCGYIFLNYSFHRVYSSLDNITVKVDTKTLCLVTNDNSLKDIKDLTKEDIGIMEAIKNSEFHEMALDVIDEHNLKNKLIEYKDYIEIINALLKNEIKYAFLPKNYESIYNANKNEEATNLNLKVLHTKEKVTEVKQDEINTKSLSEPFSILLMGTDVILDSYNADTLMVVTVNPKTLKTTMLSIPRDTYATIACTGGKHKINASGWYGDKCVVKTVEKYLDIDIDYYAKMNFFGIVELVDELGGIEVNVPYSLCEQNSKRQFGEHMVFVDEGLQTLNGEQALALSRNRHYWTDRCPKKYTTDGNRSDITRGKNQQLVIQAILNKVVKVRSLNKLYNILDIVGDNMATDMNNETILSFYNVAKEIMNKLDGNSITDVMNIKRLTFKSYGTSIYLSGLQLSTIVNYEESVKLVSQEMKKNLGLIKNKTIKTFEFDVNDIDENDAISYNKLSTSIQLLPNFVGKTLSYAFDYCQSKGLTCKGSNEENLDAIITSQSIAHNTDITTLRGKVITLQVEENNKIEDKEEINENINPEENTNNNSNKNENQDKEQPNKEENNNSNNNNKPNNDNTSSSDSNNSKLDEESNVDKEEVNNNEN